MPQPIPEKQRERVLALARGGAARREIAEQTGVSLASVSRICRAAGHTFDRAQTSAATVARAVDLAAARTTLSGELLDDVAEARTRMRAADSARDFLDLAKATTSLTLAHIRLAQVDQRPEDDTEAAKSMLGTLGEQLRAYAEAEITETQTTTTRAAVAVWDAEDGKRS